MTQNPEHKRPPVKWIVPIPKNEKGSFGRPSLCAACRGNDIIAIVLNFFLFEASTEAERKKVDTSKVQSIQLHKTHDEILEGIQPCRLSKKTLIDYNHKLEEWGFIKADGYRHTYEVFFQNVTEAMTNPPAPEKRKPRGRHVKKVKTTILEVKSTISASQEVKPTISEDCSFNEIVNLKSQIVNLKSEMLKLQSEMLALQSVQSSYGALKAELDGILDAYRLRDCNRHIETKEFVASLRADDAPVFLSDEDMELGIAPETLQEALQDFGKVETTSKQLEKVLVVVAGQTPTEEVPPAQQALIDLPIVKEIKQETVKQDDEKPAGKGRGGRKKQTTPVLSEEEQAERARIEAEEKAKRAERTRKHDAIYNNMAKRRGGEVAKEKRTREYQYIWKLIDEGYDPETVDRYHQYLTEDDWHYNKPGDKARVTAKVIYDERETIKIALADPQYQSKKPQQSKDGKIVQMPKRSESSQKMSYVFDALEERAQANIDKYSSVLEDDPFEKVLG